MSAAPSGRSGRLVVLSGPSGVGKDTVLRRLFELEPRLRYSVSCTTRPPREGELDGVAYSFVDVATFHRMEADGTFLETANVHGNLYGTALAGVREAQARGEDIILKIDVQGAAQVREKAPDALLVFLMPPSVDVLRERLRSRDTEDEEALRRRLDDAVRELAQADSYDHRVINDDVDRAAREILSILAASADA